MNYGYIRAGNDKQTAENQRFEIERFCAARGLRAEKGTISRADPGVS